MREHAIQAHRHGQTELAHALAEQAGMYPLASSIKLTPSSTSGLEYFFSFFTSCQVIADSKHIKTTTLCSPQPIRGSGPEGETTGHCAAARGTTCPCGNRSWRCLYVEATTLFLYLAFVYHKNRFNSGCLFLLQFRATLWAEFASLQPSTTLVAEFGAWWGGIILHLNNNSTLWRKIKKRSNVPNGSRPFSLEGDSVTRYHRLCLLESPQPLLIRLPEGQESILFPMHRSPFLALILCKSGTISARLRFLVFRSYNEPEHILISLPTVDNKARGLGPLIMLHGIGKRFTELFLLFVALLQRL